ncbi:MAG: hypothetical protein R2771_03195 [Saprospiraceae bacterium]
MAGVILLLRKDYFKGGIIFTIAMGMELLSNHVQMTYYFGIVVAILVIAEYIEYIKNKDYKAIAYVSIIFVVGLLLVWEVLASKLWTTYEYSKETMRGTPILKTEGEAKSSSETKGLEWNYAMQWSNSTMDLFSTFIRGIVGGGSSEQPVKNSKLVKLLKGQPDSAQLISGNHYTGSFTIYQSSPYMGAFIIFLFILGLLTEKSIYKWWALIAYSFTFLLSMGKISKLSINYFIIIFHYTTNSEHQPILGLAGIPIVFLAF